MQISQAGPLVIVKEISHLQSALPKPERLVLGENAEEQARAMLSCLLDRIPARLPASCRPIPANPATCPNCDTLTDSIRSPYCGEPCREMAGFVRQFRSGLAEGSILDHDRQVALGQVLWHILGGGRPLRQALAPARSRETAIKREGGRCQVCGAPATTIDHIGSGCNRPINLRAVCESCCLDRPFGDPTLTDSPQFSKLLEPLSLRIASPIAIRCCDDAGSWSWRQYVLDRRARLNR